MKKAKKKGKSYSQGWFERQSRRFMSVLLCSSMLSTSVANTAAFAAATSEGAGIFIGKRRPQAGNPGCC